MEHGVGGGNDCANEQNHRSHSLDIQHGGRGGGGDGAAPGEDTQFMEHECPQYRVLADYNALSGRELTMHEGEVVELVKIGCAGWWYVRLANDPNIEGWAPQTYLEKLPSKYRTLDRK